MIAQVGQTLWTLLHATANAYPDEPSERDKESARYWLDVFSALVKENSRGCKRCLTEWEKMLQIMPIPLDSRADFYLWTIAAHDRVNRKLGKPILHPEFTLQHPLLMAS